MQLHEEDFDRFSAEVEITPKLLNNKITILSIYKNNIGTLRTHGATLW